MKRTELIIVAAVGAVALYLWWTFKSASAGTGAAGSALSTKPGAASAFAAGNIGSKSYGISDSARAAAVKLAADSAAPLQMASSGNGELAKVATGAAPPPPPPVPLPSIQTLGTGLSALDYTYAKGAKMARRID